MTAFPTPQTAQRNINRLDTLRRSYLIALSLFWILANFVMIVVQLTVNSSASTAAAFGVLIAVNVAILWLIQRGRFQNAVTLYLLTLIPIVLLAPDLLILTGSLGMISAAMLGNRWLFALVQVSTIGRVAFLILERASVSTEVVSSILLLVALGTLGIIVRIFIEVANRVARESQRSAQLLADTASIGQELAQILQLDELLPEAVELIRRRFEFYHVQVFLMDASGEYAELAASTGAVGRELLARHHRLAVGSQSVIGQTTQRRQPVIARHTDAFYYRNELLPDTRSELALPIVDGERVVGALDVQSHDPLAFQPEDTQALQTLANLLATSIRNARLFTEQSQIAQETKRMFLESETNLQETQRISRQATRKGWQDYWQSRRENTGLTLDNQQLIPHAEWSEHQIKAAHAGQVVQEGEVVAAPLMIGSEVIGVVEVEASRDMPQSEALEIVNAVAQRLALSLDKARLYEESQDLAAQEQRINEISSRYQTVANVDDLLRITLSELSQSLGAKHGAIRLGGVQLDDQKGSNGA
ncbi:MAG: GAF domain-containing protein [Anaerolineaceae bacterium]|nr:GAF domain-containing protein [Anaerolineaceae bacterium]